MKFTTLTLISTIIAQGVRTTYHPYEEDRQALGAAYDNSPGWCGIRYSVLNVARITAVHGMNENLCGRCLAVQNVNGGPVVHVLAVDWKGDPGLDMARSSYQALNPGTNPLDPSVASYRIVDQSLCSGICQGGPEECTPGRRNLLPASLLPSRPMVPATLGGGGGATFAPQSAPQVAPRVAPQSAPQVAPRVAPQSAPQSESQPQSQSQTPQGSSHSSHTSTSVRVTSTASSHAEKTEVPTTVVGSAPQRTFGVVSGASSISPAIAIVLFYLL
jgi:hypothetical protein